MGASVTMGEDRRARCPWGAAPGAMRDYHDFEWGRPVLTEVGVFERVCLEGFQAGLSWSTILAKRPAFRDAFAGFDPQEVAAFDDDDVERLVSDARIIRHRGKILATIGNARALLGLHADGLSLAELVWEAHLPSPPAPSDMAEGAPATPESKALSSRLRERGFRFVGPTTTYAAMQAVGVVNDHLAGCWVRDGVERARGAALGGREADP